jgi:1,4-dihydroxy-2-naphthoyl-CoA synthase
MIDYELVGGIAYIRLNRPEKLNAFTNSGLSQYVAAPDRLDHDNDAKIGIVSGAGRAFSALRETVRYRRSVLAEALQHATIVAGNFKWNTTDGFKDAIRARASR